MRSAIRWSAAKNRDLPRLSGFSQASTVCAAPTADFPTEGHFLPDTEGRLLAIEVRAELAAFDGPIHR